MRHIVLTLLGLLIVSLGFAQGMKIGIYHQTKLDRVAFSPLGSSYQMSIDGVVKGQIHPGEIIYLKKDGAVVTISKNGKWLASGDHIALHSTDLEAQCKVKPLSPSRTEHIYADVITARVVRGGIRLVNEVEYPDYVAGVVEAESGKGRDIEFYKTQSILCRTYAISNRHKHINEGFHLCDKVHCQVYHGISSHDAIIPMAVESTKDLIAVDHQIEPINALFHSNCGGQTISAADVWSKELTYCKSIKDPYCLKMPQSNWEKTISKLEWLDYLSNYHEMHQDSLLEKNALTHYPRTKQNELYATTANIPLKQIRKDWKLRSTFFAISEIGDSIVLTGMGYGHGVGLCQEGAIHMAELDFKYDEILHFYYHNIHIINQRQLDFFRDDD